MTGCTVHTETTDDGYIRVWCDPCGPAPTDDEMVALVEALETKRRNGGVATGETLNTIVDVIHRHLAAERRRTETDDERNTH